jgi:hypothetical protein
LPSPAPPFFKNDKPADMAGFCFDRWAKKSASDEDNENSGGKRRIDDRPAAP